MAIAVHHVHVKTRDPKQTLQFYVDNLGAKLTADRGARGYTVDLHGLMMNITPLIDTQTREQHYGMEHIAVDTDDYTGTLARFRANGVQVLEELPPTNGRRVGFLQAPDGVQIEVIERT
jgi:catechol 2,3-dioxygenase-like lactoylglutathione lyase family enzyme